MLLYIDPFIVWPFLYVPRSLCTRAASPDAFSTKFITFQKKKKLTIHKITNGVFRLVNRATIKHETA